MWFHVVLSHLYYSVGDVGPLLLQEGWVVEEDCGRSTGNRAVGESYDVVGWSPQEGFFEGSVFSGLVDDAGWLLYDQLVKLLI